MKKLIAISVMMALVAGAAFAQVGGNFRLGWNVVEQSDNVEPSDPPDPGNKRVYGSTFDVINTEVNFSGANEDETLSYSFRVNSFHNPGNLSFSHYWAKWQVIPELQISAGVEDGWFGYDGMVGWGFHQGGNDGVAIHGYDYGAGNGGGTLRGWSEGHGLGFEITPMDALSIYFALPINDFKEYKDIINFFYLGAKYGVDGIGTFNLHFRANLDNKGENKDNNGQFGFGYENSFGDISVIFFGAADLTKKINLGLSLGVGYDAGDFGVKFRAGFPGIGEGYKFAVNANVMPYYKLSFMEARLSIGVHYNQGGFGDGADPSATPPVPADYQKADDKFMVYINPYLIIPVGGPTLMVGLQVDNIGRSKYVNDLSSMSITLPVVLNMSF